MAADNEHDEPLTLSAEEARQGRIVLNTRLRKTIFFGGLIAIILLPVIAALLWR